MSLMLPRAATSRALFLTQFRASKRCTVAYFTTTADETSDYEKKHHLGRALSRSLVTPEERRKWSAQAKKYKGWDEQVPFIDQRPHGYELDALEEIHERSFQANVLLEIRDVRLPSSTHHPSFTRLAKHRTHLICYTHSDMIDSYTRDRVLNWTRKSWPKASAMFVDMREHRPEVDTLQPVYEWIANTVDDKGGNNCALTVGVPNTGKSSVLGNLLRTAKKLGHISKQTKTTVITGGGKKSKKKKKRKLKKSAPPGIQDVPGKTRELTEYLLRDNPRMFFLDVPGMTPPHFVFEERPEMWFGMGAANLLVLPKHMKRDPDVQLGFCSYVLHCLNRDCNFDYVHKLRLPGPTQHVEKVLDHLSNKHADRLNPDALLLKRCENFLKLFNTGNLGSTILDDIRRPHDFFRFNDRHFQKRPRHDELQEERRDEWLDDDFDYQDDLIYKVKK